MSAIIKILAVAILLSSCQIVVNEDGTDTVSDTQTDISVEESTSLILYGEYTQRDYTLNIDQSNYINLYPEYQEIFIDKNDVFLSIIEDDPYSSNDEPSANLESYTDIYSCPVSGELTIYQEYTINGDSSVLSKELISTDQCKYEQDLEVKTFEYMLDSQRNLTTYDLLVYENFTYINQYDEVVSAKSATLYEDDQTLFEAYINSENLGRYLIRIYDEFEVDEQIIFYGENDTNAILVEETQSKDIDLPCLYQNNYIYEVNGSLTQSTPANWVDACVDDFDSFDNDSYETQIPFYSEFSVLSQSLSIIYDSTPIRSVFTVDNDDALLELTIIKDNEVFYQETANVIVDPFISLDAGNYYFYFRNVNFDFSNDRLFYQIETKDSFIQDYLEGESNGAIGYVDNTYYFEDQSGAQKDAEGNIRQQLIYDYTSNVFIQLTSDVSLTAFISNTNEQILYDSDDILKISKDKYYLSVTLDPGVYYLDVGSTNAVQSDSVDIIVMDEIL